MRLNLKLVFVIFTLAISSPSNADDCRAPSNPCPSVGESAGFFFEARAITAGPYGEMWTVKLDHHSSMTVEANWMLNPMGSLKGSFLLDPSDIAKINVAADAAKFFSLPKKISPSNGIPIHAPDLQIRFTSKGKTHLVNLYAPAEVADQAKVARFMSVWSAIHDKLPVRPSWK